ncbi:MAG TPA: S-layer family protein, partial [Acetobacteraceae bacterium]|nr:S-layer family protein [Acetobacteraceae bacterium]
AASFIGTNTVVNVGSFGANGFVLDDGTTPLSIGTVIGGTLASIDVAGLLTVNGLVSAAPGGLVDLTATSIAGPGTVTTGPTGAATLVATAGTIDITGPVIAGLLSGASTGTTDLPNAMIGTLGGFSASALTVNDFVSLTVAGPVIATAGSVDITSTGSLTNNSTIQAATTAVLLASNDLVNAGSVFALGGDASLTSTGGALTNSVLIAASGNATLTAGTDLTNTGSVFAQGGNALLTATGGTLSNGGLISASANATLTAGTDLGNTGSVVAQAGNALLTATGGTLSNGGLIQANANTTLQASAGLSNTGSIIAQTGNALLTASGGTLSNGGEIFAGATIVATASNGAILQSAGASMLGNTEIALNAAAGGMALDGAVSSTGTVALQSGGTIYQNGSLIAAILTGSAAGAANLLGSIPTANQIGTLGSFSAGGFALNDGEALAVAGPVNGGASVAIVDAAALTVNGSVVSSAAVNLTGASIAINGYVTDGGAGATSLTATNGDIGEVGTLIAGTLSGSATGAASLTGATPTVNQIADLANFSATNLTLDDGSSLTVVGPVTATAGAIAIATQGALTNDSVVTAATNTTLTANTDVTNNGSVLANTGFTAITASNGALANNGLIQASTGATLTGNSGGNSGVVNVQAGSATFTTTAGALSDSGVILAAASTTLQSATDLTIAATGSILALGGNTALTATGGSLTNGGLIQAGSNVVLTAAGNLATTGQVVAQGGSTALTASGGSLTNGGLIQASTGATLTGVSASNTGQVIAQGGNALLQTTGGSLTNGGLVQARVNATLTAAGNLATTGQVVAQTGSATLAANGGALTNGGLVQAAGNLTLAAATSLGNSGSAISQSGNAGLTAANGTLLNSGLLSAAGTLTLASPNGAIMQSGAGASMTAGEIVTSAAGNISLDGLVKDATGVVLTAGGNITQDGELIADILTGSAGGNVDLAGATPTSNQVAELGNFTAAGGTFLLNDGVNLLINGVISAASIQINDPLQIVLGNGGFVTGGAIRPATTLQASQLPTAATDPGAYLAAGSVLETGGFSVSNLPGTQESILSITLTNPTGSVQFGGTGLNAPNTWLILGLFSGTAGGSFNVKALDIAFLQPPGSATFVSSTINGFTGNAAAGAGNIEPQPNTNFRIDGCPIHSVNCAILSTQSLPEANPLNDINLGSPAGSQNEEDLVLPVVSDERYELLPCDTPNGQGSCDDNRTRQ